MAALGRLESGGLSRSAGFAPETGRDGGTSLGTVGNRLFFATRRVAMECHGWTQAAFFISAVLLTKPVIPKILHLALVSLQVFLQLVRLLASPTISRPGRQPSRKSVGASVLPHVSNRKG